MEIDGSKFRTPLHANVSLHYQTFKFKMTNVFLAPGTVLFLGKKLKDVNDKDEIKSASFPSFSVPYDRYSDTPVSHCPRWMDLLCDWQFETNAANRDIACTTRGDRVIGGFMLHRSARTRHGRLGRAFSASSVRHRLARSCRRV